jgi:hypothetical protein
LMRRVFLLCRLGGVILGGVILGGVILPGE